MSVYRHCVTVLIISLFLGACASNTEQKVKFSYSINATEDINPDRNGSPSSVVVRVFQLSNKGNFDAALYEDLFNGSTNVLGAEMIAVNDHLIDPGSSQTFNADISANTQHIGVAVGYRSLDQVTWKAIQSMPEKSVLDSLSFFGREGILISVEKHNVRVISK